MTRIEWAACFAVGWVLGDFLGAIKSIAKSLATIAAKQAPSSIEIRPLSVPPIHAQELADIRRRTKPGRGAP